MKIRFVAILLLLVTFTAVASAQKAKSGTALAQITASTQVKEIRDDEVLNHYTFATTWKGTSAPEAIFYKAADEWKNCMVLKAGKEIYPEQVKKGSKIVFKTVNEGRFAIPDEIAAITIPALFFQVKGQWYYVPVKNIRKKSIKIN